MGLGYNGGTSNIAIKCMLKDLAIEAGNGGGDTITNNYEGDNVTNITNEGDTVTNNNDYITNNNDFITNNYDYITNNEYVTNNVTNNNEYNNEYYTTNNIENNINGDGGAVCDPVTGMMILTPPPVTCDYLKTIRLDGNLGVGPPEMGTEEILNPCTGTYYNEIVWCAEQEAILATLCRTPVVCLGEEQLPAIDGVEGNTLVIPAGWKKINICILPDTVPGAELRINGRLYKYCCPEHFDKYLSGLMQMSLLGVGQEITIEACPCMVMEVTVTCCIEVQQEPIILPPKAVAGQMLCMYQLPDCTPTSISWCKMECGPDQYTVINPDGTRTPITEVQYATEYLKEVPASLMPIGDSCEYWLLEEMETTKPENRTVIRIQDWLDPKTKTIVYALDGDYPNMIAPGTEGSNLIDISKYFKMLITTAPPVSDNLKKYLVPFYGVICLDPGQTITYADILAHAIANGGTAYDGTPPTGLLNTSGSPMHAGLIAKDAKGGRKKVGAGYLEVNAQPVNAGTPYCLKEQPPQDEDCDGFLKGEDLATAIANVSTTDSAAYVYSTCLIKMDADDTDDTVQ